MAEYYKHFWKDKNKDYKYWCYEGVPDNTLDAAIDAYENECSKKYEYSYTLCWNDKDNTCERIDIEEEIAIQERLKNKKLYEKYGRLPL